MLVTLLVALFIIGSDQIAKMQIVQHMLPGQDIPVINGILHLHYAQNSGAAFSMLQGSQWVFIVASVLASLGIIIYLVRTKMPIHWLGLVALGLVMGGALGNLIDRIHTPGHYVIDYVYVKVINFAIFNVADAGISVGAVLLCIYILFIHEKYVKKVQAKKLDETEETNGEQTQG
jgi:signal peptidase II